MQPEWFDTHEVVKVLIGLIIAATVLSLALATTAVVLRLRNEATARRWQRFEAQWQPLVLAILSGDSAPATLSDQVGARDADAFLEFLAQFGRHLRGTELDRLGEVAAPFLPAPMADLHSGSPEKRARAVHLIGVLGRDQTAVLIEALDDPAPLVGLTAARALTRRLEPGHVEAVVSRLHRFRHWRPAFLGAMLGALGADAAPILRWALGDARQAPRVRAVVADALADLADPAAGDVAARAATTATDAELIAACLRLLARSGQPDHLPTVRRHVDSEILIVRIAAFRALGALAVREDVPRLEQGLDDPSPWVAEHAAVGLASTRWRHRLFLLARSDSPRAVLAREALAASGARS